MENGHTRAYGQPCMYPILTDMTILRRNLCEYSICGEQCCKTIIAHDLTTQNIHLSSLLMLGTKVMLGTHAHAWYKCACLIQGLNDIVKFTSGPSIVHHNWFHDSRISVVQYVQYVPFYRTYRTVHRTVRTVKGG
eukprot:47922-Chlamydomonas_euryale.AAC.1